MELKHIIIYYTTFHVESRITCGLVLPRSALLKRGPCHGKMSVCLSCLSHAGIV